MWFFNSVIGKIFDILFLPFRGLSPWVAMIVVSFLTGLLMLFIFRHTSNQEGIRRIKNKIKAHLLELRLYKDSLAQQLTSQGKILSANFKYFSYALKPMLVMVIPVMLILIQLNLWFGSRSLNIGDEALVKVKLIKGTNPLQTDIRLEVPPGIAVETPPLRIEDEREIDWRLRAAEKGVYNILFRYQGETFTKSMAVGQNRLSKIAALKPGKGLLEQAFNPGEKPLPKNAPIESAEITYPGQRMNLFGWRIHWLIAYFGLSIVFGFAFRGVFKVEI
jgi:uncharacterized membrane protein (DUF106 family)